LENDNLKTAKINPVSSEWIAHVWSISYVQGRPQTDAAALGPAPTGAPRHAVWAGFSFLPDTPCAPEL